MIKDKVSINIISSFNHANFIGLLKNNNDFKWQINDSNYNQIFQILSDKKLNILKKKSDISLIWSTPESISPEFKKLLNMYNGKTARHGRYDFESINVISAGERDPDAQGLEGMSASKMRDLAARGDKRTFINAVPIDPKTAEEMYNQVRTGLKLNPVTV